MSFFSALLSSTAREIPYEAIVFIQWSQSNGGAPNGVQEGDLPAELQGTLLAEMYDHSTAALNGNGSWEPYRVGVNSNQPNTDTDGVGPDTKFIERMQQVIPNKIRLIKWAPGGIGLKLSAVNPNYNVASTINSSYDHYKKMAIGQVEQALRDLRLEENMGTRRILIAAIMQIQGEEDAKNSDVSTYYYSDLSDLVTGLLTVLSDKGYDTTLTDYILMRTHNNLPAGTFPYVADLRTEEQYFADNYKTDNPSMLLNNIHVINTDAYGLMVDNIHWDESGVISAGTDMAATQSTRDFGTTVKYTVGNNAAQDAIYLYNSLPIGWQTKIAEFIDTLDAAGEWYKLALVQLCVDTEANSLIDMRGNNVFVNTGATFTADSHFAFNGSSNYLSLGRVNAPAGQINYNKKLSQDSCQYGVWVKQNNNTTTAQALFGLDATRDFYLLQQPASDRMIFTANDATFGTYSNASDDYFKNATLYSLRRSGATARALLEGQTVLASDAQASTGIDTSRDMYIGARNGSSITNYANIETRFAYAGAGDIDMSILVPAVTALMS